MRDNLSREDKGGRVSTQIFLKRLGLIGKTGRGGNLPKKMRVKFFSKYKMPLSGGI